VKVHPKHVEQFPDMNKLCNAASCWIYIGILLGAHPILLISRIRVHTNLVINKCVTAVILSNFAGHNLRNRSTLDIGVLGYIGVLQH
jgi:hypothetical protein